MRENSSRVECDLIGKGLRSLKQGVVASGCTALNLHGNDLSSLQGITANNACLTDLNLSSNSFASLDLPELSFLTELQVLDVGGNTIDSLVTAPFLPGITQLSVAFNNLQSLAGLAENFPDLETVDVRGNLLADAAALAELRALDRLQHVQLGGGVEANPISTDLRVIASLFSSCAALRTVDGRGREDWLALLELANAANAAAAAAPTGRTRDAASSPVEALGDAPFAESPGPAAKLQEPAAAPLRTPRFDAIAQRYRRKSQSRLPKRSESLADPDASAFFSDSSPEEVDIVDVYAIEIGSPQASPSPQVQRHPHAFAAAAAAEDSPRPRERRMSPQLCNPWALPSESARKAEVTPVAAAAPAAASAPAAIDPALAADMKSLLGALRLSGLPPIHLTAAQTPPAAPLSASPSASTKQPREERERLFANAAESAQNGSHAGVGDSVETEMFAVHEREMMRMQIEMLESEVFEAKLVAEAAAEASATALREAEQRVFVVTEEARVQTERANSAAQAETDAQFEIISLRLNLAAMTGEFEVSAARVLEMDRGRVEQGMLHAEELQRAQDAQQHAVTICQLLTNQVADGTARIHLLETENAALLRSIDEYSLKMDVRRDCEAEQNMRLAALASELEKSMTHTARVKADTDATSAARDAEREVLKRETAARVRDWEKLLAAHTEMLALERARSLELGELEKASRSQFDTLERRFKQLERAFEQAVTRNDSLAEQLAAERDAAKRSHDTVTELGEGIRKLQSALSRATEYKRSAQQLQQTLIQARAENDSLLLQLSVAQQLADQSRTGVDDSGRDDSREDSRYPGQEAPLLGVEVRTLRQRTDDLEQELHRTTMLLRKSEELVDLLSRKSGELAHAIQVKDTMLNDQAAAIADLKERIHVSEGDTINAESVITNLEEQLDDTRIEITRLQKAAGEQAHAAAQVRKMMGDYRAAVRTQLDREEDSDSGDDMD